MDELLQTADAAKAADVTPSAIHRAVLDGRLKAIAVTRRGTRLYRQADVEAYLRSRRKRKVRTRAPHPNAPAA